MPDRSGRRLSAGAATLSNDAGHLQAGWLDLNLAQLSNVQGVVLQTGERDSRLAGLQQLDNRSGTIQSQATNFQISSEVLDSAQGNILHTGSGLLALQATTLDNRSGRIDSLGTLSVAAGGDIDNQSGLLSGRQALAVNAANLDNRAGHVQSAQGAVDLQLAGRLRNDDPQAVVLAGTDLWSWLVGGTGAMTLLLGAYIAMFQNDLKRVLAYSTISHLGLITLLLGLNSPLAAVAAVFHIMNHATFKASLFMAAGIVDHETGTRDIRRLNGLIRAMPRTGVLALVATGAMAGVPLLNGFLSKEMFFAETVFLSTHSIVEVALPVLATVASAFAVVYSLRFGYDIFFGAPSTDSIASLNRACARASCPIFCSSRPKRTRASSPE